MSSWNCRHEVNGICQRVDGAYCRPGMQGCILVGKVKFEDGVIPSPVWPPDAPARAATASADPAEGGSGRR